MYGKEFFMNQNINNTELRVKFCNHLNEDVVLTRQTPDDSFHCMCSEICKNGDNCNHYYNGSVEAGHLKD